MSQQLLVGCTLALNGDGIAGVDIDDCIIDGEISADAQVFGFYRNELQCSPDAAGLLTDLCTYRKMLPTGSPVSPVSPVLSFWANRNLFNTLNKRAQEQHLKLSVYVDNVTVSGQKIPNSLSSQFAGIVSKHGHGLAHEKTKVFAEDDVKHVTGIAIKMASCECLTPGLRKLVLFVKP